MSVKGNPEQHHGINAGIYNLEIITDSGEKSLTKFQNDISNLLLRKKFMLMFLQNIFFFRFC